MKRIAITLAAATLVAGCSSPMTTREKGALAGGAIGAGTGAIIGSQVGHAGAGALIGAGVGVVSGAIIGDAIQDAEQRQAYPAQAPAAVMPPPPPPPPVVVAPPPPQVVVVAPPPPVVVAPPRQVVVVPPPGVVVAAPPPIVLQSQPRMIWVPQWNMHVLEHHDVVYHSGAFYHFYGGYWWVGRSYAGPWAMVTSPPGAIARLPRGRLHAHIPQDIHCPPGQAQKGRC